MSGVANNRRTKYTKMVIQDEFFELLDEKELDKISVKELCEKCDINRGTFYNYYKDIYDLYDRIEDELWEEVLSEIKIGEVTQAEWIEQVLTILKNNKRALTMVIKKKNGGNLLNKLWDFLKPFAFEETQQYYGAKSVEEADLFFTFYIQGSIGLIMKWFEFFPEIEPKRVTEMLLNNLLGQEKESQQ